MNILIINAWSSSLKYQVIDMKSKKAIVKWMVEKIWLPGSFLEVDDNKIVQKISNHTDALKLIVDKWLESKNLTIDYIWHRVVHWWEFFSESVIINANVIKKIKECFNLAPLHNPANLEWILACKKIFPKLTQVAVFDTAFFQSMEEENYIYPIPYKFYQKDKIRRYWFHWTSHKYVYNKFLETHKKLTSKVVTCHVWNWASITAIDWAKVVETSLWLTPLEGLVMWTRSWNIDPSIVTHMLTKLKLPADKVNHILNKESWLLWLSWVSSDMREILAWVSKWNKRCQLALDIYINSLVKYIGSYASLMNWVDAIVLTAWVMERSQPIREILIKRLSRLWIKLDKKQNKIEKGERIISTKDSKVKVMVIPTNEELEIANETMGVVSSS